MTDAEIKKSLEICNAATEGPWYYHAGSMLWITGSKGESNLLQRNENRRLTAHARTALPKALKELQEQREVIGELCFLLTEMNKYLSASKHEQNGGGIIFQMQVKDAIKSANQKVRGE